MKCPKCNETLVMSDRQGIEIDYCPNCRGVWLDRGELDKIIERSADFTPNQGTPYANDPRYSDPKYYSEDKKYYDKDKHYDPRYPHHKKKKGFLSDFFDFD